MVAVTVQSCVLRRKYGLIHPTEYQTYFDILSPCRIVVPIQDKFLKFMSHYPTMMLTKD
jgi:hypothetical protein